MLSPSDIRSAVEAVLRTADSGLTTYEILNQLPDGLRQQIIIERGMPGLGSGNSYSAASLVTDATEGLLPSLAPPYRVYVHGQAVFDVAGQEIRPGNNAIALYRLNPPLTSRPPVSENEAEPITAAVKTSTPPQRPSLPTKQEWFERPGMLVLWFILFWPIFLVGMYYNGKAAIAKERAPWYEETPWLIVSALFFPLFFVGLFSSRKIQPRWKWTIAGSFALLYGVFALTYHPDTGNSYPTAVDVHKDATGDYSAGKEESASPSVADSSVPIRGEDANQGVGVYVTKGDSLAAIDPDDLNKAYRYGAEKDYAALQKMLDSGRVILLKPGIRVRIVSHKGLLAETVKVHPIGDTTEFWTANEALEKP